MIDREAPGALRAALQKAENKKLSGPLITQVSTSYTWEAANVIVDNNDVETRTAIVPSLSRVDVLGV